jgi:hypothetical protein
MVLNFFSKGRLFVKRLIPSLLAIAIAIPVALVSTGCSPGPKMDTDMKADDKAFAAEAAEVTLDAKDAEKSLTFKNGDPDSVDPADKEGITAKIVEKKITFKATAAPGDKDVSVEFTVKGGKDKKETTKITAKIPKKKS